MNKRKFEKIFPDMNKISRKVRKTAEYIVDNEFTVEGNRLTGDAREYGIIVLGTSMAIGENLTKGKYLRQGFCIGVTTTIIVGVGLQIHENMKSKKAKHERKSSR